MCCAKRSNHFLNLVFILGLLVSTVVAVPTSVLVQNSEVTSNINAANNNHNQMTKVKRSSNNANEMMSKETSNDAASTSANKKSSPEVLPPAFNMPSATQHSIGNNFANGNKASGDGNFNSISDKQGTGVLTMPSNEDIINSAIAAGLTAAAVEAAAASSQRDLEQQQQLKQQGDEDAPTLLHKRGVSTPHYLYGGMSVGGPYSYNSGNGNGNNYGVSGGGKNVYGGSDYYNNAYLNNQLAIGGDVGLSAVPNGVWADEMDPAVVYTDIQEDDYLPAPRASSHRSKAYDNLQNILNAEAYPESMALSLTQPQYTSRFYGALNGNKRSNRYDGNSIGAHSGNNRFADMRLKRDTKLTPADMLALVALVEAGERARKDTDTDTSNSYMYPSVGISAAPESYGSNYNGMKNYYPTAPNAYDYPANLDELDDNAGTWLEPNMVDYYGVPMNMETIPKYELQREHKYASSLGGGNGNRYGFKRFMVAKKKRSMGNFLNEPVSKPSISNNVNGEKIY
ncbi:PREDICTED: uncharacterized protein LOC108370594 [Rhagoletis zephyria]|uniref:uncharacterized protein LOC108370594 n=1 Tax=Rhagoletis zephyria TaxID=28612 RepID=UPI000811A7FE|nr:PREDICTED: uncharacterized protein LOC108370594 [Rhagoletis zephyria]XP_017481444.1 PREDICTED: uncharacterized protein LOC108370594 [Rhagoletis zephyria]